MKKVMFIIVAAIIALSISGAMWNRNCEKNHGLEIYQKKLAKQNELIEALSDSVEFLNAKAEFLQITLDCLRDIDSSKVEEAIHLLWDRREE